MGAQSGYSGAKRWEDKYPEAAEILRVLTDAESQQEPTFQSSLAHTLNDKICAFSLERGWAKDTLHERCDVKRLSMDCKATVNLGEFARGGKRGVPIRL